MWIASFVWQDEQPGLPIPEEFLKKNPHVLGDKMIPSHKKMYSWWILDAKRPETRTRRIQETIKRFRAGRAPGM